MSADSSAPPTVRAAATSPAEFGRAALAILATMVILIVALTGVLVQTTWGSQPGAVETPPADPGSFARR